MCKHTGVNIKTSNFGKLKWYSNIISFTSGVGEETLPDEPFGGRILGSVIGNIVFIGVGTIVVSGNVATIRLTSNVTGSYPIMLFYESK